MLKNLGDKNHLLLTTFIFGLTLGSAQANFFNHTWAEFDLGGGYQRLFASSPTEISKGGTFFNGRGQFQYRTESLGDFALGFGMQRTYQNGQTAIRIQQFVSQTFLLDLSYLYPLGTRRVMVGALLRDSIGEGAQFDFSNTTLSQQLVSFGPQIKFQFAQTDTLEWSTGAAVLFSLNGSNRTILDIPLYLGVSFPFPRHKTELPSTISPEPSFAETTSSVAIERNDEPLNFDLNESTLRPASRSLLQRLAKILTREKRHWTSILIAGHTDVTGNLNLNQGLSQRRAIAVREALIKEGVPSDRLNTRGYAANKLLPGLPEDSELNRRVELILEGALNGVKIENPLSALKISEPKR